MKKAHHATNVIVIGAGIAGLSAARMLAEAGKSVLLLEAANRIGGRIRSQTVVGSSEPIELGAEFIHGLPDDLLKLLKQADLETYELTGHSYSWEKESLHAEHEEDGKDDSRILDHLGRFLRRDVSKDVSFAAYLDQHPFSAAERERLTGYVEGFNAADATRISTQALGFQQAAENEIDGDRLLHVRSGYSSLPAFVFSKYEQAGGKVRFQHRVDRIQWAKDHVTVTATVADETMIFTSRCVVIAVPLGVLQEGSVAITPWPEHLHAMTQMAMGQVHRISMIFKERFWSHQPHEANDLSFLFARQLTPSVWWTSYPSKTPVLTAWIGGTRVKETEASHLLETTLASLAHIFTISRSELGELLVSSHTHDWNNDPLSRGAYSYVCTGGLEASSTMSKPTEGTVFVAGEHTDVTGHWGTVHGALRSGIRAARQVIEALGS